MKALKIIYSFVTVACVFYGIPLTIINIGKEAFMPNLLIAIIGLMLLSIAAAYIAIQKREKDKEEK